MSDIKTQPTKVSPLKFLEQILDKEKRDDAMKILKLMKKITKERPVMWGSSIIGFGTYHYKGASGREGEWPLAGFSPRKQNLTVYIMLGASQYQPLLKKLGKYKISGGSCLYIKKLADIDLRVLEQLIQKSYQDMVKKHK